MDACAALVKHAAARKALARPRLDLSAGAGPVSTLAGRALLEQCGVTAAACRLARSSEEAVRVAEELGYLVALKIESPDIAHKTEAQGVMLGLKDAEAVRLAYVQVIANARRYHQQTDVDSVIVQSMVYGDVELVVGLQNDPVFGVVVMAGLGGIHVEVLKDVVFRAAPVTPAEAGRMLDELKGRAILAGVRGRPPVDRAAVTRLSARCRASERPQGRG